MNLLNSEDHILIRSLFRKQINDQIHLLLNNQLNTSVKQLQINLSYVQSEPIWFF
jgi:hypothetical protein